jgi:hypothetical protein
MAEASGFVDHSSPLADAATAPARLDQMAAAFRPAAPIAPQTPRDAELRLAELSANGEWYRKLMAGDIPTVAEFQKLTELKASADTVDPIGGAPTEITIGAEALNRANTISAAESLRSAGLPNQAIEAVLTGATFSPADVQAAQVLRDRFMRDQTLVNALLSGDADANYTMLVYNSIISAGAGAGAA